MLIRTDCAFPTLYQIRQQGLFTTPVAYATAHVAALFIKFFPREVSGVFAPEQLPAGDAPRDRRRNPRQQSEDHAQDFGD